MPSHHAIRSFVLPDGERYCLLIHVPSGVPLYYPALYVTTKIRNASTSVSVMEAALSAINILLAFCRERKINLEERVLTKEFFAIPELDGLRDACQQRLRHYELASTGTPPLKTLKAPTHHDRVGLAHEYNRLTYLSKYLVWLISTLLGNRLDERCARQVKALANALNARRPTRKGRNAESGVRALGDAELMALEGVQREGGSPFKDEGVVVRNRLILRMLVGLGLRSGELLGVRIRDVDFHKNQLVVMRRPDQKDDPRVRQPRAKSLDRRIPLSDMLAKELYDYVVRYRRAIPGARKHDYLFITHKSGPTQGAPLSISALQALMKVTARSTPELAGLHGHRLRHTWNDRFSREMDERESPPPEGEQEQVRAWSMGWKQGSGTAATYNKRFIEEKAQDIQLKLQEGISPLSSEPDEPDGD